MKVYATKPLPSNQVLIDILKNEFSHEYKYELSGLGNDKSIIIHQSPIVGAQISAYNNEFTVVAISPSIASGLFSLLLQWSVNIFMMVSPSTFRKLEKEISEFLNNRFN